MSIMNLKKTKKSQVWSLDLMIAAIIFSIGIVVVYLFILNLPGEAEEKLNSLMYEGNSVASNLLTQGGPYNWHTLEDEQDIVIPGLLNAEGEVDLDKVDKLSELANSNPGLVKGKINTIYDFCVNISTEHFIDNYDTFSDGNGICTSEVDNPDNLIKITRFAVYQDKPVSMIIQIWGK